MKIECEYCGSEYEPISRPPRCPVCHAFHGPPRFVGQATRASDLDPQTMGGLLTEVLGNVEDALKDPNLPEHHRKKLEDYRRIFKEVLDFK